MSSDEQIRTMRNLACMLHSAYFSTVKNSKEASGLFASLNSLVKGISSNSNKYAESITKKNIETIIADLEKTGLYQCIEATETWKGYEIKIEKCLFAGGEDGVHNQLRPVDVPCIVAYSIAQFIAQTNTEKRVYIHPSAYNEEGTQTSIDVLTPEAYAQKMRNLAEVRKIEKELQTGPKEKEKE